MFNLEKTLTFQYGSIIGYIYILLFVSLFQWGGFTKQFGNWGNIYVFLTVFIVLCLLLFGCLISFGIFLIIDYKFYYRIKNIKTTKNSFYRVIQYIGFGIYVLISLPFFLVSIFTPPYIGVVECIIFLIIFLCLPKKTCEINQSEEGNINDKI